MNLPLLSLLSLLILIGCSNVAPIANTIAPPPKSAPVAPVAAKVKKEIVVVKESNQAIEHSLDAAINELSRLSQQKSASEKELADLWDLLQGTQSRVTEQWLLLGESEKTIDELNNKANTADVEVIALRDNLSEANTRLTAAAEWQTKNTRKVAIYDWLHSRMIWLIVILAVGGLIYLVLKLSSKRLLPLPLF